MNGKVKPVGFDYGTPPDAVVQQEELINSMVSTQQVPVSVADPAVAKPGAQIEAPAPEDGDDKVTIPTTILPEPSFKTFNRVFDRVELEYVPEAPNLPAFQLSFTVGEVCIREHYISLLVVNDIGFKPTTTMKFDLRYKGKTTPVIFAGAEFEFQTVGVRGISFLIDKKRRDESRTIRNTNPA